MKKLFIILSLSVWLFNGVTAVESLVDKKVLRYHSVLLKRPESSTLYERFQTGWLAQGDEASLEAFLTSSADNGGRAERQLLATFFMQRGMELKAVEVLSSALKLDDKHASVYLDRGKAYASLLDFEKAVADVNRAIELAVEGGDSFLLSANKLKGRFLTRQGKTDEAVAHWKGLVKDNAKDQELVEDVIDILITDGLFPSAMELAVDLRDKTRDAYKRALRTLRIGDILSKQGERDKALRTYVDTLEFSGVGSWLEREILGQIQMIYKKEDNLVGLVKEYADIIRDFPQRVDVEVKLATLLVELERFDEANKVYLSLLKKSPLDDELRMSYLEMLRNSGDLASARKVIDVFIERKPGEAKFFLVRAGLSDEMGLTEDVLADLNAYKGAVKASEVSAMKYLSLLVKYGFRDKAIVSYREAMTMYPGSLDVALEAAEYFYECELSDEAVKVWRSVSGKLDLDGLVRLLEALSIRQQYGLGVEVVRARYDDYRLDARFLGAAARLCELAEEYDMAVGYSYSHLLLCKSTYEVGKSLNFLSGLLKKCKKVDDYIKKLEAKSVLLSVEKFLLASLYESAGELERSDKLLADFTGSKDVRDLLQLSRVYELRYDLLGAAKIMEELIALPNGMKSVHLKRLSEMYQRLGNSDASLATIQKWKTLSPSDKQVWMEEVALMELVKGTKAALEVFRKGVQRFGNDVDILAKLATLHYEAGQYVQADLIYWKLYNDAKGMSDKLRWVGELIENARIVGNMAKLVDELTRRRRNSPNSIIPIMSLATLYSANHQFEERRHLLLEATRLLPDNVDLLIELASIDIKNGSIEDAIVALSKAKVKDKTKRAGKMLGELLMDEGDIERALEEFDQAGAELDARSVEVLVYKLIEKDEMEMALVYLDKSLHRFPDDWRLMILKSIILYEQGFNKRAAEVAIALFTKDNEIKNISLGWEVKYDYQLMASLLRSEPIPDVYCSLSRLKQGHRVIYSFTSHLQNYHQRGVRSFGYADLLPKNVDSMKVLSHALFLRAIQDIGKDERLVLLARAEREGMRDAHFMSELYPAMPFGRKSIYSLLLDKIDAHPENTLYYNHLIVYRGTNGNFTMPGEIISKAHVLNKGRGNSFVNRCLEMFTADEMSLEDRLQLVLLRIQKDGKVDLRELAMLNMLLDEQGVDIDELRIDAGVLKVFQMFFKANDDLELEGQGRSIGGKMSSLHLYRERIVSYARVILKNELFKSGDYATIISEIERDVGGSHLKHALNYNRVGQLAEAAWILSGMATVSDSQLFHFRLNPAEGGRVLDRVKLGKHLDSFTNPILKLIAIHYVDPERDLSLLLEELKMGAKTRVDACILHAYLIDKKGGPVEEVLEQLNLARVSSLEGAQRSYIDYVFYCLGMRMDKSVFDSLSESLQSAMRVTARRLMISLKLTDAEQIQKLITKFSMEGEEARYLNKNKTSARKRLIFSRGVKGGLSGLSKNKGVKRAKPAGGVSLGQKVKNAIALKQVDKAVYLIYREIRGYQRLFSRDVRKVVRIIELVKECSLEEPFMKKMEPRGSGSPSRWLRYLELARIMNNNSEKLKAISKLSSMPVVPIRARFDVAMAIFEKDSKRALTLLERTSEPPGLILIKLLNKANEYNSNPQVYVRQFEFINLYVFELKSKSPESFCNILEVRQIVSAYEYLMKTLNDGLKGYYVQVAKDDFALVKRRDEAISTFLLELIKGSRAADIAFGIYMKYFVGSEKYGDGELALVKESLLRDFQMRSRLGYVEDAGESDEDDIDISLYVSRKEYLVQRVLAKKDTSCIDDAFLRELKVCNEDMYHQFSLYKRTLLLGDDQLGVELKSLEGSKRFRDFKNWYRVLGYRSGSSQRLRFAEYFVDSILKLHADRRLFIDDYAWEDLRSLIQYSFRVYYEHDRVNFLIKCIDQKLNKLMVVRKSKGIEFWSSLLSEAASTETAGDEVVSYMLDIICQDPLMIRDGIKLAAKHGYPLGYSASVFSHGLESSVDQYKRLLKSGYLNNPDKVSLVKMPVYGEDVFKALGTNPDIRKRLIFTHNNVDSVHTVHYCLGYIANFYKDMRLGLFDDDHSDFIIKQLSVSLKKAPKENSYGAGLLLTLIGEMSFAEFVRKHSHALKGASADYREAFVKLFKINHFAKRQTILKLNHIDSLFSFKRKAEEKKAEVVDKVDVGEFLARTKPFEVHELESVNQFIRDFIKKNVALNVELTSKVLNHYAVLLDKSRVALKSYYKTDYMYPSPLQVALISETMSSFQDDPGMDPFYLLRLIYRMDQLSIRNKLNMTMMIRATVPYRWPDQSRFGKMQYHQRLGAIAVEQARFYHSLSDESEKLFIKAAWLVYSTSAGRAMYYFGHGRQDPKFTALISRNPELKGFLMYLSQITNMNAQRWKDLISYHRNIGRKKAMARNSSYHYRGNGMKNFLRIMTSFPLRYRLMGLQNLMMNSYLREAFTKSSDCLNLLVESYEAAMREDATLGYSEFMRYLNGVTLTSEKYYNKEQMGRLSVVAGLALEKQIEYMNAGDTIHQNQFVITCSVLALTDGGKKKLLELYKKHSQYFIDIVPMAKLFLKHGFVDEIPKILPDLAKGVYNTSYLSGYFQADKDTNKHVQKLLSLYKTDREKAMVLALVDLEDDITFTSGDDPKEFSIDIQRAKNLNAAYKSGDRDAVEVALGSFSHKTSFEAAKYLVDVFKDEEREINTSIDDLVRRRFVYRERIGRYRAFIQYLYVHGKYDTLERYLKKMSAVISRVAIDGVRGRVRSKPYMEYEFHKLMDHLLNIGYLYMHDLYGAGDRDAELRALLPHIRKVDEVGVKLTSRFIHEYIDLHRYVRPWYPSEANRVFSALMHDIMGEKKVYDGWFATLDLVHQKKIIPKKDFILNTHLSQVEMDRNSEGLPRRYLRFLERLFNEKKYQEYMVKWGRPTEHFSALMDHAKITPHQVVELYDVIKIDYKVPAFEAYKYGDLAHAYQLLLRESEILPEYAEMNRVMKVSPQENKHQLARAYLDQMNHLFHVFPAEKVIDVFPKELYEDLDERNKRLYDDTMKTLERTLKK